MATWLGPKWAGKKDLKFKFFFLASEGCCLISEKKKKERGVHASPFSEEE